MIGLARALVFWHVLMLVIVLRLCGVSDAQIRRLLEARVPDYAKIERLERELFGEESTE